MAQANPLYGTENFSTTLNVGGGIDSSQTTGIVLTSVSGLNTNGGVLGLTWASTLDSATYEEIIYTGITGNELTGVTRGSAGTSGKAHNNGATVISVVSSLHNNRIADKLRSVDEVLAQDPNNNEIIETTYVASAVNEIQVSNAATGNPPIIAATGGDTNIDLKIIGKGTGVIKHQVSVVLIVVAPTTDTATGDGKLYFVIPPEVNGMVLSAVFARVITAGTTNTTDIQLHNVTDAVDILSTKMTIDSTETSTATAATPAVINASNDDMATNDLIRVDVDAVSTTAAKGLILRLTFGF